MAVAKSTQLPAHDRAGESERTRRRAWRLAGRGLLYLTLLVGAIVFTLPTFWMVSTSLKLPWQATAFPPEFIPNPWAFETYPESWEQFPFWVSLKNTMVIELGVLVGRMLTASLVGYGFARLRFPGREWLFLVVLSTLMIPYHVTLVPQYLLFKELGWLNTPLPLIVPWWFGGGAFFIFLLRQFFRSINREMDEAARIDGCGTFTTFWYILLPMSLPALGVVAIFTFLNEWNDFLAPLIYLNTEDTQTLAIAIQFWRNHATLAVQWQRATFPQTMAMSTILTIPPVLVFFFLQRYFIQGIVVTGVKG